MPEGGGHAPTKGRLSPHGQIETDIQKDRESQGDAKRKAVAEKRGRGGREAAAADRCAERGTSERAQGERAPKAGRERAPVPLKSRPAIEGGGGGVGGG